MYAMKKHINKVLAAFLCACLLLSYNPAFGTATNAWADETTSDSETFGAPYAPTGSHTQVGELTDHEVNIDGSSGTGSTGDTVVQAGTFTSDLLVNITEGPLFATTGQIKDSDNPFELIVQATCSEADNLDDYEFKWTVSANGKELTKEQQDLINSGAYNMYAYDDDNNVASVSLDMKKLIKNNPDLFQDDVKYDFKCEVTMKATDPVKKEERNVTLLTVSKDLSDSHSKTRLEDESEPTPVVATGHFLSTAELKTELAEDNKGVIGVFSPEAQRGSTDYEKFGLIRDAEGKASQVYQVGVEGALEVSDTITLGAAKGSYDLWFPIDEAYVYDPVKNPTGYQEHNLITVLWKDRYTSTTEDLQRLTAEIVYDAAAPEGTGKLMAKVTYNPAEVTGGKATIAAKDESGKDTTYTAADGATNLPGFFALVYSSNKTKPKDGEKSYYSVSATVNDETMGTLYGLEDISTLEMDGEPVYVETGTSVRFNVLPKVGNDGKRYQLTSLTVKSSDTAEAKEVLNGSTKDMGITIDAANSCVVIGEPACKQYYAAYSFEAKFELVPDDLANYSEELVLRVVNEDDMSTSTHGIITASYMKLNETDNPQKTEGNDYTVLVQHGGYADLGFMVNAGLNDTNYEIKRVETSATGADGTWAPAAWLPGCQLSLPHITGRMYVRVVVGTANTTVSQPLYYNVIVKAADGTDPRCKVKPESGIIAVKNNAYSELSFEMTGVTDKENGGFYAQSYTITEGSNDNDPVFFDLKNDEAKNTGTFSRKYTPSDAVKSGLIKGDIVIEVTFHTTNPTPRQLTLKVVGGGQAGLAGGGLVGKDGKPSLLNKDGVATVGSGESFTILTVPDNGYMLNAIRVVGATIGTSWPTVDEPSILKTGVYVGKMPDEDITVTVTFTDIRNVDLSGERTLNVYVADKELMKAGSDTEYIWNSTVPVEDSMGATIADPKIDAPEEGVYRGSVNGMNASGLIGLKLPMGDPYIMNFKGDNYLGKQYAVSQVLVVPYHLEGTDGNKTKVADGRTLYNWNTATFALNYKTWTTYPNVDVIVYFDEVTATDPDGNLITNQPDEYAKLIIPPEAGAVLKETLQPPAGTTIEVLPGGYVSITDMWPDDGMEWDDEDPVLINGEPISEDDFKKLKETGVLVVGPMPAGGTTEVTVNIHKKDVVIVPETFPVSADNPTAADEALLGAVYVTVDGDSDEIGVGLPPVKVPAKNLFEISFEDVSARGYQITDVAFMIDPYKANDPAMKAWYLKNVSEDGTFYNSLVFSATRPTKDYTQYNYTNDKNTPNIPIGSSDATLWHVEGLMGDMVVLPTFDDIPDKIDPNNEAWKVQAGITAGKGSLTMSYNSKPYGNQVNVPKKTATGSANTLPVYVNIKAAAGYKLKNVTVKTSSDNPLINFWNWVTGGNVSNMTQTVNANDGQLTIAPVEFDYEILVEFENTDTSMLDTTTIPINVYGDTNKGTVKPNTNVRANRDGKQTFTVDVKSLIDDGVEKWYSVESVKVTAHYVDADGNVNKASTVTADATTDKSPVTWGSNEVMFTVDIAEANAGIPANGTLSAVDVEVVYGPANHETKPEPATNYTAKQVTIRSSTGGGVVSPYGTYEIYPYMVDESDNGWAKFLVVVSPQEGYTLTDLKVTRDGATSAENEALAASYLAQLNGESTSSTGCFYIDAVPGSDSIKNEVIDIQFGRLSASDRTYTIYMSVDPDGTGSGTVVTKQPVTLPLTESFSYSINVPSGSNTGIRVKDQYKVGDGANAKYYDVPNSAATQAGTLPIERSHNNNCLLVNPAAILNQVVDRYITITFENLPAEGLVDPDDKVTPINKNDKVSIKVNVYSNTTTDIADALHLTPYASLNNVLKSDKSHYLYNWWFDTTGTQKNYYVYCVKVNNTVLDGYADTPQNDNLKKEGSYLFDKDTLQSGTNYLDIYVGSFLNGVVSSGGNGGDIEVDWGTGGWVQNLNGTLAGTGRTGFGSVSSYFASLSGTTETDVNGIMTFGAPVDEDGGDDEDGDDGGVGTDKKPANMVKVYNIIPQPGYVIDHVYLYNCHPYPTDDPETEDVNEAEESWQWTTPSVSLDPKWESLFGESWDKYIVLQYALELDKPNTVGYMYASFEYKGTGNIGDMDKWDPTDDKNHDILGNDNLFIHYYPHDYAKEVAPLIHSGDTEVQFLHEGSQGQNGTVAVRGRTEDMGDRYIATYSTFEEIAPGDMFTFRVGPLLPEDGAPNAADKLYTIDVDELNKKMPNVTVTPVVPEKAVTQSLSYGADDEELAVDENEGIATLADDANANKYYKYYTVRGTAAALGLNNGKVTLQLPLDKLTVNSGEFPELPSLDKGTGTTTTYTLEASAGEGGTITPTTTTAVASWDNGDTTGPWTVASGTRVAFSVQADDDYRLTSLTRNGTINCLANGNYTGDAVSGTLLFPVYSDTSIVAEFTPKSDSSASRTVTIAVQGGHGTTSPAPGTHPVEKGQPYSITFQPETGYVPYRIWVDGVESFAGPTWVGYTLPASWSNQTFTVQYAVAGTTPTTGQQLVQTGQNVLNDAATGLVRTGDNPVAIACIVGVAVLAAAGVWQMRRRKATAARAAKYSVTKRRM